MRRDDERNAWGGRLWRLCVVGLISSWLAACWPNKPTSTTPAPKGQGLEVMGRMRDHGLPYHRNPQARQAWRMQVEIEGAPGPLVLVRSGYSLAVQRPHPCLPPVKLTMMGVPATAHPTASTEFALHQVGEGRYEGVFYTDVLLDEDYFGLGVCPWVMQGGSVVFSATGSAGETRYVAHFNVNDLFDGFVKRRYYAKTAYPINPRLKDWSEPGHTDPNRYVPALRDDLFSITLKLEAQRP